MLPALILCWLMLFTNVGEGCRVGGRDYDPHEHTILCSQNLTLTELLLQEMLRNNESAVTNPGLFDRLLQIQMDDLMAVFREAVADLYIRLTCKHYVCHPQILTPIMQTVPEGWRRSQLKVVGVDVVTVTEYNHEIMDLVHVTTSKATLLITAFTSGTDIDLRQFTPNGISTVPDFVSYPASCLATTKSLWGIPLVAGTICEGEKYSIPQQNPYKTHTYIYKPTETSLELIQAIETDTSFVTDLNLFWQTGNPNLILVSPNRSIHYDWATVHFLERHHKPLYPAALDVEQFRIGQNSFLAFSRSHGRDTVKSKSILIYRAEADSTEYRMFQKLPYCSAVDLEHFTMSNLHFLAAACDYDKLSHLFWWSGSYFLLWQSIPTQRATSWSAIRLPNLEVVLGLISYPENIPTLSLYEFDEGFFTPLDLDIRFQAHHPLLKIHVTSFNYNSSTYIAVTGRVESIYPDSFIPKPIRMVNRPYGDEPPRDTEDEPTTNSNSTSETPTKESLTESATEPQATTQKRKKRYVPAMLPAQHEYPQLNAVTVIKLNLISRARAEEIRTGSLDKSSILQCMSELQQMLDAERRYADLYDVTPDDVMLIDTPQIVGGTKVLSDGLYAKAAVVENLHLGQSVTVEPESGDDCMECSRELQEIQEQLNGIFQKTSGLVQLSQPRPVSGLKTFNNILVNGNLQIGSLTTGPVCGVDFKEFASNILKKTGDQQINTTVTFEGDLFIDNVQMNGLVNGVDLKGVATMSGDHVFKAPQTFVTVVTGNIVLDGTLNDIDPKTIVLADVPQVIRGRKTIVGNVNIKGTLNTGRMFNKEDLRNWTSRIMTLNTPQVIHEDLVIDNDVTVLANMDVNTVIGYNLTQLPDNVLTTDTDQVLKGYFTINADAIINGDVDMKGLVNKVDLDKDLLTTNTEQIISSDIEVVGDMFVRDDLQVNTTINDLDVSEEVVTKYTVQEIIGHKTFKYPVTVNVNISLPYGAKVNKHDLSQLGLPQGIGKDLTVQNLQVDLINGLYIPDHLQNLLLKSSPQDISAPHNFLDVGFSDLHVQGKIAQHKFPDDFITLNTEQSIQREVVFTSPVKMMGNAIVADRSKVDGLDLSELDAKAVKTFGDQRIRGRKTFTTNVAVRGDIAIPSGVKVNGLDLSEELLLANEDQEIKGFYTIKKVVSPGEVFVDDLQVDLMNNVDVRSLMNRTVVLDRNLVIAGNKEFMKNVKVDGILHVDSINGLDLKDLQSKIVRLSGTQDIMGHLTFRGPTEFRRNVLVKDVNGYNLQQSAEELALAEDGIIKDPVRVRCITVNGDITDVSTLNQRPWRPFIQQIVSKTLPQTLGAKILRGNITIDDLTVEGLLDGVASNDVVLVDNDEVILGATEFLGGIKVLSDVNVRGTLNGVVLDEMYRSAVKLDRDNVINGPKTFVKGRMGEMTVENHVNGINLANFASKVVLLEGNQTITGDVIFNTGVRFGDLITTGLLQGVDVTDLYQRAMTKSGDQVVTAPKHFRGNGLNVDIKGSAIIENIPEVRLVDGVNLKVLMEEAVNKHTNQTIDADVVFEGDLVVNEDVVLQGPMNSLRVPEDFVLTFGNQTIQGVTAFPQVKTVTLNVKGKVNGIKLDHVINQRVTLSTPQTIPRHMTFIHPVTIKGNLTVNGRLNDLDCARDIVTTHTKQDIWGDKVFETVQVGPTLQTDFINGIHWKVLVDRIDSTLHNRWVYPEDVRFEKKVTLNGIWSSDHTIHSTLNELQKEVDDYAQNLNRNINRIKTRVKESSECIQSLAQQAIYFVEYLDRIETVQPLLTARDVVVYKEGNALYLLIVVHPTEPQAFCGNYLVYSCSNLPSGSCTLDSNPPIALPVYNAKRVYHYFNADEKYFILANDVGVLEYTCMPPPEVLGTVLVVKKGQTTLTIPISKDSVSGASILFSKEGNLAVFGFPGRIEVKKVSCKVNCSIEEFVTIPSTMFPVAIRWFNFQNIPHLLIINSKETETQSSRALSYIYRLEDTLTMAHSIYTVAATDGTPFSIGGNQHIAIGSFDCSQPLTSDDLTIYRMDDDDLVRIQSIRQSSVSVVVLYILGDTFLVSAHPDQDIFVYRWSGYFLFTFWTKVSISRPRVVTPFSYAGLLYLAVAAEGKYSQVKGSGLFVAVKEGARYRNGSLPVQNYLP